MINEVSPPGWGHTKADKPKGVKVGGTAHAMQKAQKRGDIPKKMNIFALMWSMKNKDDNPHYKPGVKGKLKGKYKGPEGQNEMIDPKKIRNYKNVPNSVVAKADKEAEKVKDKEQKGTLEFPQMPSESKSSHPGMQSHWEKAFQNAGKKRRAETRRRQQAQRDSPGQRIPPPPQKDEGWGAVAKAADELEAKSKAREDKARNKKVSSWAKKEDMKLAPQKGTKGRKAAKALYAGEDIDMPSLVAQAIKKLPEGEWADSKAQEKKDSDRLVAKNVAAEKRYQAHQAAKKQAAAKKEEVEMDEKMTPQQRRSREGMRGSNPSDTTSARKGGAMVPARGDYSKTYDKTKQFKKNIGPQGTPAGAAAHKAQRGVKKVRGAKEEVEFVDKILALDYKELGFETQDDLIEYAVSYYNEAEKKDKPEPGKVYALTGRSDQPSIARGDKWKASEVTKKRKEQDAKKESLAPRKQKPKPDWVKSGPKQKPKPDWVKSGPKKEDYVSDFGNKLRQAIEEAKKVNAIDTINKIVKTKTMGKLHGQQVDLFTASAIQSVYNALNKKNQEKMTSVMSKDVHGLLKMADFSMKQMKR